MRLRVMVMMAPKRLLVATLMAACVVTGIALGALVAVVVAVLS